jgi:hypothetical protein
MVDFVHVLLSARPKAFGANFTCEIFRVIFAVIMEEMILEASRYVGKFEVTSPLMEISIPNSPEENLLSQISQILSFLFSWVSLMC